MGPAENVDLALEAEEARLARAAAAGDGEAFATLYERYARRAYNLALRLSGSSEDAADAVQEAFVKVMQRLPELGDERELAFGSYLLTATRNATYDLLRRQQRARPSDSIPDSAVPLGSGAGGLGLDPGDPDEDPDRRALLAAQREQIAAANARLPERQREALALRELEEMSYDEIAATMGMNRNSVAQLISRARINLRDELRGTALASVAVSSPECERALPLIAARDDRQLGPDSPDAAWLAAHLSACGTCGVASEAMQEAGVSYRAWIPVAVAPWVFRETMARAAELAGVEPAAWRELAARRSEHPTAPAALPGLPRAYRDPAAAEQRPRRRRRAALAGALAVLLLLGGAVVAISSGGGADPGPRPLPAEPVDAVVSEPQPDPGPEKSTAGEKEARRQGSQPQPSEAVSTQPAPEPRLAPSAAPSASPAPTTGSKAKPDPQPKGGEAGLGGGAVRDPQPQPVPPAEPPPPAEPEPQEPTTPQPPPQPPPRGPGDLATPGGPTPVP